MQFDLEPGDFVINPKNTEWGIGQIPVSYTHLRAHET